MSEQNIEALPAIGVPGAPPPPPPGFGGSLPGGPAGGGSAPGAPGSPGPKAKGWRPSKKLVIIGSAVILVLVAAVVALFIVKDIIRGGEKSPEAAGIKLIESVNNKDIVGLFTTIAPHERDSVMRLQTVVVDKFKEFGIAEALKKVSPEVSEAADSGKFVLDGVEITVSGVTPVVTEISADFAQLSFNSGEVHTVIHPDQTKGALRSALDAADKTDVIENTVLIPDLGPNEDGLVLIAAKTDGRWYLSPMLSALELGSMMAEDSSGMVAKGAVPDKFPAGGDSPQEAASAAVRNAVSAVNGADPALLAPSLVKDEAAAFYMYADLWNSSGAGGSSQKVKLGASSFTQGPQDGNRALTFVENVSLSVDGDTVSISDSCFSDPEGDKTCHNGSGYAKNYSSPSANPMSLFTVDGKFGLTTVKEDGKWKVSVLDTATDMAISWLNSLTKEQALALLRLDRTDAPSGAMTVGKAEDVAFNSAGYAVRTLEIDTAQNVILGGGDSGVSASVYSADLQDETHSSSSSSYSSHSSYFELKPGSYVVVLFAADEWQELFDAEGNKVTYSASVTPATYVEPATIEHSTAKYNGSLTSYNDGSEMLELDIPKGTTDKLVMSGVDGSAFKNYVVEIDGKKQTVPVGDGVEHVIVLPAKNGLVNLSVSVGEQQDQNVARPLAGFDARARYELEFVKK